MSDYGLNFGARRVHEGLVTREGRLKVPVTGTFRLGSLVTFDPANPGYLKVAAANEIGEGGTVGLLTQEEIGIGRSIYGPDRIDSFYLGVARNNKLAVINSGAGAKFWFKNTLAQTRADGRQIAAVQMVDLTGVAVKDYLTWDGSKFVKSTAGTSGASSVTDSMLRVTLTNGTDYCEAVLVR